MALVQQTIAMWVTFLCVTLLALQCITASPTPNSTSHSTSTSQNFVRIVVVGRSGSGVSTTIRELIGPLTKCVKPEGTEETLQTVYEYTISNIPDTSSSIKLIDIPGFVDGRTPEQDAQILATLKSYYASETGPPDFFLAVSRFDDNFLGAHSLFVKFLKRIDLFKKEFLERVPGTKMNLVFLLTRLMSETKATQRRPEDKVNRFKRIIEEFSLLAPSSKIVVGDNNAASEHNVRVEGGYSRLPNKEHYPKNVWEAMMNATTSEAGHSITQSEAYLALKAIKKNRETEMKCEAKFIKTDWEQYDADANAFLYLMQQELKWTIELTEVNLKIQNAFNEFPLNPDRMDAVVQKTALQLYLQNENITKTQDLPTSYTDRAALFHKSSLISSIYPALLLIEAFKLEMPEYVDPLTVGYGYDVLRDELSLETPFRTAMSLPSPVGYQFPNFMQCRKLPFHEIQTFQSYSHNIPDYFKERVSPMNFLSVEDIDFTTAKFELGSTKEGFNLAPEEGGNTTVLTAVKEFRTLKCKLDENDPWGELSDEFVETVNALTHVNLYNRDSISEWEAFFKTYGTHIVSEGYGGGKLVGTMTGANLRRVFDSQSTIDDTLDSILSFSNFSVPDLEMPSYGLFGGEVEESSTQIRQLFDLPAAERGQLLKKWSNSLNSVPIMLKNEFTLERISRIVKEKVGSDKGRMVDDAIGLLLLGELKLKKQINLDKAIDLVDHAMKILSSVKEELQAEKRRGSATTGSESGREVNKRNHSSHGSVGSFLSNLDENQKYLLGLMSSQIQNSNVTLLGMIQQSVTRHQMRFPPPNNNTALSTDQQNFNETEYIRHQQTVASIQEEMDIERLRTEALIENLQRMNEEAESKHELLMNEIRQRKRAEKQREMESRCSGLKILHVNCWTSNGAAMLSTSERSDNIMG